MSVTDTDGILQAQTVNYRHRLFRKDRDCKRQKQTAHAIYWLVMTETDFP